MTELEERVMIEKAKAGDPKANYEMCLWALEQAETEPGEERWKRLAAKCLVQSAQAGYGPAQKKTEELISGWRTHEPEEDQTTLDGWDETPEQPVENQAGTPPEDDFWAQPPSGDGSGPEDAGPKSDFAFAEEEGAQDDDPLVRARAALDRLRAAFGHTGTAEPKEGPARQPETKSPRVPARKNDLVRSLKEKLHTPAEWSKETWKKVEIGCAVVGAVMVILIAVLLITGGKNDVKTGGQTASGGTVQTTSTPGQTSESFPSTALRSEIQSAASLDYFPLDDQYLTASETRQVNAGDGLNLRRGPASTYATIRTLFDGLTVEIDATKDGWALVNAGGTWGWASMDYLK
jgi:hypothetical protein